MRVSIGTENITKYIVVDSYTMNAESSFESWRDGNGVEHRVFTNEKIKGSFDVVLSDKNGMPVSDFTDIIAAATTDGYTMLFLTVTNRGVVKSVNAYLTLETKTHAETSGGVTDVITVKVEER